MSLMSLGDFVFELSTAPFTDRQRTRTWRKEKTERFKVRPAHQFVGIGDDTVNLSGVLYNGQVGHYSRLEELATLADAGQDFPLLDGAGNVWGNYSINQIDETDTVFFNNGTPRKKEFSLQLERGS